ncbi:MAG: ion channel [Proteobacteria bacterium]|nr:ion channel [Pseudomonadota bacterium]
MPRPTGLPPGARRAHQQGSEFYVIGDRPAILRDAFHSFLKLRWSLSLLLIGVAFFLANLVFAVVYWTTGGIAGTDGSFFDALAFSVETMATVGYGAMHPASVTAHVVMIVESITGIIVGALATGVIFSKFSRPTTRIAFSAVAVITPHEGKRSLVFRVGNRRGNVIVEATLHVVAVMTTTTAEGDTFYKAQDLRLVRDRQVGMTRGWTVIHVIDETSPLFGLDNAAALARVEMELFISLTGIDDVTAQTVHTIHRYDDAHIRCDHHLADTLSVLPDGTFVVDLGKFDEVVPDQDRASVRA